MASKRDKKTKVKRHFDPLRSLSAFGRGFVAKRPRLSFTMFLAGFTAPSFMMMPVGAAVSLNGFAVLSMIMMSEKRRRQFWEQSISFKILELTKAMRGTRPPVMVPSPVNTMMRSEPLTAKREQPKTPQRYDQLVSQPDKVAKPPSPRATISARTVRQSRPAPLTRKIQVTEQVKRENNETARQHFYSDTLIREFIQNALNKKTIRIQQTPTVRLSDHNVRMIALSAEIEAYTGSFLKENRYLKIAEKYEQNHKITALVLNRATMAIQKTPTSDVIYMVPVYKGGLVSAHLMGAILDIAKHERSHLSRLAFEMGFDDFENATAREMQMMRNMAQLGVRFSLRGVKDLAPDVELLNKVGVKTLTMPAAFLLPMMGTTEGYRDAIKSRRLLESAGLRIVVDGVDTGDMLIKLKGFAPSHAQGKAFGNKAAPTRKAA